jgi:hypothetical protein
MDAAGGKASALTGQAARGARRGGWKQNGRRPPPSVKNPENQGGPTLKRAAVGVASCFKADSAIGAASKDVGKPRHRANRLERPYGCLRCFAQPIFEGEFKLKYSFPDTGALTRYILNDIRFLKIPM